MIALNQKKYIWFGAGAVLFVIIIAIVLATCSGNPYRAQNRIIEQKINRSHEFRKDPSKKAVAPKQEAGQIETDWGNASTSSSKELLKKLKGKLDSGDDMQAAEAIQEAEELGTPEMIEFAYYALRHQADENIRWDAVGLLEGLSTKDILPVLAVALRDKDEIVQTTAVNMLTQFNDSRDEELKELAENPDATEEEKKRVKHEEMTVDDLRHFAAILTTAMNSESQDVKDAATGMIDQLSGDLQILALDAAITSTDNEVRNEAMDIIAMNRNKDTIQILIDNFDQEDDELFEHAQDIMENLVDKRFNSAAEANAWWQANQNKYDYDLVNVSFLNGEDEEEE